MPEPAPAILIVEDHEETRCLLKDTLSAEGYAVEEAKDIAGARRSIQASKPALIVLDVGLPDGSGVDLCREIRADPALSLTPVVMLSGRGRIEQKGEGFAAGADQYLVKPVKPRELLLWVRALLRRLKLDAVDSERIEAGDLLIDVRSHLLRFQEHTISNLTPKEFDLFVFLVTKRPELFSRQQILTRVWHTVAVPNTVDMHLHHLRGKLPGELALRIQSVPGKGFRYFG